MWQTIGELLPSAVGPIPIIAIVLMLGAPRARSNGPAFAAGWVVGLVVTSVIVLAISGGAGSSEGAVDDGVNWFQIVVGCLFLAMAARQWTQRPVPGEEPQMPPWMAAVESFRPARSFGLGLLLSGANPKNLACTASAAALIAQQDLSGAESAWAVAAFLVVASVTVVVPVVMYLLASERSKAPLQAIKDFMTAHNTAIMMAVLLLVGGKILGKGLAVLN